MDKSQKIYKCPCESGTILEYKNGDKYIDCEICAHYFNAYDLKKVSIFKLDNYVISGFVKSKLRLEHVIKEQNKKQSLVNLFEFLGWAFAIREKCNFKKEKDVLFWSLKDVYDINKHNYNLSNLVKIVKSSNGYSYPKHYPFSYEPSMVFGNIDANSKIDKERLKRYENNLCGKDIHNITNLIFKDTIRIFFEYDFDRNA